MVEFMKSDKRGFILQSCVFPGSNFSEVGEMCFHLGKGALYRKSEVNFIDLPEYSYINTGTYFNSFSLQKWKKYTVIEDLYLNLYFEGKCLLKWVGNTP